MDFVEYGELPEGRTGNAGREAIKEEYAEAKKLAVEGKVEDIEACMLEIFNLFMKFC